MADALPASGSAPESMFPARRSIARMLRSHEFWAQRSLHPVARLVLLLVVGVLLIIALGFVFANGELKPDDLLAVAFYAGLAAFAWHPMTAAFVVMLINSTSILLTRSGGDLLELAMSIGLVAATCAPWVVLAHAALVAALTASLAAAGSSLASGGIYGIAGIAVISFLVGVAFRLVAARETFLIAERARVTEDLEAIARQDQERIADELHDGIAHDLTLVLFHARALPLQPDEAARQVSLSTIEESAEKALQSIHALLSLMRDPTTEGPRAREIRYEGDLAEAASSLGALLNDAGIPARISTPGTPLRVSTATERALVETAVEAVTNIIKHAPRSQSAGIEVRERTDAIELIVTNVTTTTPAGNADHRGGRGLSRARQRLAAHAGTLESERASGGWTLRATIPTHSQLTS